MGGITQRAAAALPGLTAFAILTAVASDQGGYFRSTWGWTGIALAWVGLVTLILRQRIGLSRALGALFAVAAGVVSWTFLSALWADDGSIAVREGERAALYLVAVIVVALISRPGGALQWAGGSLAAASAVAAYALARAALFTGARRPDPYEGFHLSRPLGYANALGIFCALGLVAAVGVVAERTGGGRGAAAGAAAVFLAAALSLTSSRGAWIALAVALAVLVTVSADRINVLASGVALAPAAGAAVTACLLTRLQRTQPPLATATEGRALAAGIVMLGVLGAVIVPRAQPALARRIARIAGRLPPPMVRALPVMVAVGAALAVAVA